VTMTLHKLTAGDGYQYLIRQVAVADSTNLGRSQLSEYYSAKGESPGRWVGSGLASLSDTGARPVSRQAVNELWTVAAGSEVTAEQMRALFGEGRHPNSEAISAYVTARGVHGYAAMDAAKLGREFYIRDGETGFLRALAVAYRTGAPNTAMMPSPVNLSTVPPRCCTTTDERSTSSVMISRSRSAPTAAAMSMDCTTSANSTVTCLYSAWVSCSVTGAPQPSQNRAPSRSSMPQVRHAVAAVIRLSAASGPRGPSSPA
jgi:TrwC relaxase